MSPITRRIIATAKAGFIVACLLWLGVLTYHVYELEQTPIRAKAAQDAYNALPWWHSVPIGYTGKTRCAIGSW